MNLLCVLFAGILLIPYFRSQPESVHTFAHSLQDWQRRLFIYFVCVVFVYTLFKLFSPRASHLRYFATHPPTWSAWLIAALILSAIDLTLGLSRGAYTATWKEWAAYGLGAIVLVVVVHRLSSFGASHNESADDEPMSIESEGSPDWTRLEPWLQADAPANHDFLGNYSVAARLKSLLEEGTRSIGLVGPFGAGKSSIVKWILRLIRKNNDDIIISERSCWGFETSSGSIQSMLISAISAVEKRVDTFQVSSLPESYRQTFSAGGKWTDKMSKLLLRQRDAMDQFRRLSALLGDINKRLVFVVEDLDRNDSKSFDIQEVLAFLHQLREFPNLSFVLTGGLNSPVRIDYAKLCDHIEYLRTISVYQSGSLVAALRERCLDQEAFPHVHLSDIDDNEWTPNRWLLLSDRDEVWPPEAIARLLNTPRALRHALGLTYRAWKILFGEVDFDHLLAVNVLRYAAPEAFSFVLRHWHRFHGEPSSFSLQRVQMDQIRASLNREWDEVSENVDWDSRAARALINLILPSAPMWLEDANRSVGQARTQGLQHKHYWDRAVNGYIGVDEIRDQAVVRDIQQWLKDQSANTALVTGLCSSDSYSDVWERLAYRFFDNDRELILTISRQVIDRIRQKDEAAASSDSQGFVAVWRYANRHVPPAPENAKWLQDRITEAAGTSLELVSSLWHYWGSGQYAILRQEELEPVRRHMINVLQQQLTTADSLARITHPSHPYLLYQLIFDPGQYAPVLPGPDSWGWMAPVMLAAIRSGYVATAMGVCSLIASRDGRSPAEPSTADVNVLRAFFGSESANAIESIEILLPQVPEKYRQSITAIIESAKRQLSGDGSSVESENQNAD